MYDATTKASQNQDAAATWTSQNQSSLSYVWRYNKLDKSKSGICIICMML